ncbi:MAG: antitoxin VapB [Limimaricola cinnabarinus]|jgi:antitoxin VapB|uniref:type II toxin-antitoxin system VapB family antitoxin n=1 Tax=Limimaricola cinnabarinus TaxID=1125964 RepID=UPI0039E26896
MPLYIRDDTVGSLADKLAQLATKGNKTEAVRLALEHELERLAQKKSLSERVAALQARAADLGLRANGYDDKPLMDDLSGDL